MAESKFAHSTEEETTKIVIFGQSGVGKSAVGNVLLRRKAFQSSSQCQLLTGSCSMSDVNVGKNVWYVVDTPGFMDPNDSNTLKEELEKCFVILSPGFHVALYVISLSTRFTPLNAHALDLFQRWFGEDIYKYLQIVFNKIDLFDGDVKEYISKCDPKVKKFVEKCKFPPIAMCSRDGKNQICTDDRVQLMNVIEQIKQSNFNNHYTLEDFMTTEARLQGIDLQILRDIKSEEEETFRNELVETLNKEFPISPMSNVFNAQGKEREKRKLQLLLANEHALHKLARQEKKKQNTWICFGGVVCALTGYLSFGPWIALLGGAGVAFLLKVFMKYKKTLTNKLMRSKLIASAYP